MTYKKTIDYLYTNLPMFHRDGAQAFQSGLKNIIALCDYLGNPHNKFKTIHIAGTNGKGSVSHMLASVLQHAGYKTGLYTSPHLIDFRERIRVNGLEVPEDFVVSFVEKCMLFSGHVSPSFFELTTAMAFDFFAKKNVDIAVVETGLGGRLDSTNIIIPEISVITNISLDHMDILGDTIEKISFEKAGIIKSGIPLIIGETNTVSKEVFKLKALEANTEIYFADQIYETAVCRSDFKYQTISASSQKEKNEYKIDLLGNYQKKNLATVLTSIDLLRKKGIYIDDSVIEKGLSSVILTTSLLGRWQILHEKPLIIADTGHNEAGINYTMQQLKSISCNKLHIIFGVVKDKDVNKILQILPADAEYYFTKADIPRALDEKLLYEIASTFGLRGHSYFSVNEAVDAAKNEAKFDDAIYIGGSTFVVGEALEYINNKKL